MINNLTKEQEQKLIEHREEYLKWGLCCDTADKELAIKSITEMYKLIDKKPPYFWFCDSPIMIQLVIQILKNIKSEEWTNLGDNLGDNLRENLRDNIGENLWTDLGTDLGYNLRDNLRDNIRENLRENLSGNIRDNIETNIRENLGYNLRENLSGNIGENLETDLETNFGTDLGENLRDNLSGNIGTNIRTNLGDNLGDNIRNSDLWGQMDLYWICYYQFPRKYLNITYKKEYSEILDLWDNIGRSIGWWYPYENICFISDRPKEIHKKGIRLHNEKGAALSFRDGYSLWFLNGIDVGEKIVMTPSEKLDPELALNEKNVDIQREIIRKIGAERMLYKLQATSIDDWTDPITGLKYSLKEMKLKSGINRKYLYYEHASLKGVFYAQPVPPEIRKACIARGYMLNMLSNEETRIEWTPQKEMITMLEIEANLPAIVS